MAESLGSQASDAANKAASEVEGAAKAAAEEVKKATGEAAQAAEDVAGQATTAGAKSVPPPPPKPVAAAGAKPVPPPPPKPAGAKPVPPPPPKPSGATDAPGAKPVPPPPGAAKPVPPPPGVAKPAGAAGAAGAAGVLATPAVAKPAGAAAGAKPVAAKEEAPVAAPPKGVTRREFLNYVWGASMALFLVQFAGITWFFAMPRFRAGEFGGKISVRVADFPQTNAAPVANNPGKFWLVQTDAGINTLYKICTHLGCIYPWSEAAGIFACPCHGSQFQLNGDWIAGPAARSLDKFAFDVLDASGAVLASVTDGNAIPMPAGAETVVVNTGLKVLGQSHF